MKCIIVRVCLVLLALLVEVVGEHCIIIRFFWWTLHCHSMVSVKFARIFWLIGKHCIFRVFGGPCVVIRVWWWAFHYYPRWFMKIVECWATLALSFELFGYHCIFIRVCWWAFSYHSSCPWNLHSYSSMVSSPLKSPITPPLNTSMAHFAGGPPRRRKTMCGMG